MDAMQNLTAFIKANPEHLEKATAEFEKLHRAKPRDAGIRRVYFALVSEFNARYPIEQFAPAEVEPPDAAFEDDAHPFWTTDPLTLWDKKYRALAEKLGGRTAARLHVFDNKGIPEDS
ncbi:hypothetical protein ABH933_001218 [Nocardia sp. GP40]|uniref:hypothetical protein n=1 Tax=Nocardia sp. GP40 TaxID=3156268 RepID=UPI003D1F0F7E